MSDAAGSGFLQVVPGTDRPTVDAIPFPVANETWAADASGAPGTYVWRVWNGSMWVVVGGGGGGGTPGGDVGSTQFNDNGTFGGVQAPIMVAAFASAGNDREQIQAALDAADTGSIVQFDCRTYTLDATPLTVTKSVYLKGCVGASISWPGGWNSTVANPNFGTTLNSAGGTVFDLAWNTSSGDETGVLMTDFNINVSAGGTGIAWAATMTQATGVTLQRMAITRGAYGLHASNIRGLTITDSSFTNQTNTAIWVRGFNCDDGGVNIINNNLLGNDSTPAINGIYLEHIAAPVITGNFVIFYQWPLHIVFSNDVSSFAIIAVNTGAKKFTISGSHAGAFTAPGVVTVTGSTGNNGTYTISSATLVAGNTEVVVVEVVPSAVADGQLNSYTDGCQGSSGPTEFQIAQNQFESNRGTGGNAILIDAGTQVGGGLIQITGNQLGIFGAANEDIIKVTGAGPQYVFAVNVTGNNMGPAAQPTFGCVRFHNVIGSVIADNVCDLGAHVDSYVVKVDGASTYGVSVTDNSVLNPKNGAAGYQGQDYILVSHYSRGGDDITTLATLPNVLDGSEVWCGDCKTTSPCTGGGTGAMAYRRNGAWECVAGGIGAIGDKQIAYGTGASIVGNKDLTFDQPNSYLQMESAGITITNPTHVRAIFAKSSAGSFNATSNDILGSTFLDSDAIAVTSTGGASNKLFLAGTSTVSIDDSSGIIVMGMDTATVTAGSANSAAIGGFHDTLTTAVRGMALGSVSPTLVNVDGSGIYSAVNGTITTTNTHNVGNSAIIGGSGGTIDGSGASVARNVIIGGNNASITGVSDAVSLNGAVVTSNATTGVGGDLFQFNQTDSATYNNALTIDERDASTQGLAWFVSLSSGAVGTFAYHPDAASEQLDISTTAATTEHGRLKWGNGAGILLEYNDATSTNTGSLSIGAGSGDGIAVSGTFTVEPATSWIFHTPIVTYTPTSNNASFNIREVHEDRTIAASPFTDSTIQAPANSLVLGVATRVITTIPTAATYDVGVSGSTTRYGTGFSTASGTVSNSPGATNPFTYASATSIRITPDMTPGAATGVVRLYIYYLDFTSVSP